MSDGKRTTPPDPNIERLREALLRNAEITEKAQVFMEDEDVEESREDVTLWRDAAAALAAVSADLEAAKAALRDDAVYIVAVKTARHGPTFRPCLCVRCKSDQRELDRIGTVLAALAAPDPEGGAG